MEAFDPIDIPTERVMEDGTCSLAYLSYPHLPPPANMVPQDWE